MPGLKRTLYIGLGGTGFKTLLHTKRAFVETYGEVPPMVKFLVVDSDINQSSYSLPSSYGEVKFDPSEISNVSVTQAKAKVAHNRTRLTWLPDRNLQAVEDLVNGCGMVRTNGRIAFSFNYTKIKQNIHTQLNNLCSLTIVHNDLYELIGNSVEVNLVFSIAGGTGSGNFIDMAYLVKDIFKQQALPETSKIVGYMVLPDVYDAQLTFGKDRLYPNGYGSLADLDYYMHKTFNENMNVEYLMNQVRIEGSPFNNIIAIGNKNHNGDVINDCEHLSQMMSMAMVVSAGEISSGIQSIANNFERDMNAGNFDIENKRAIMGTLGMSAITYRASELSELYKAKFAREIAAALLSPGSNVDNEAIAWIDSARIRENNGHDDVIDSLLERMPKSALNEIYDKANPRADINNYLLQVAVNANGLNERINSLKSGIKISLDNKVREIVNANGPVYAVEFLDQVIDQIDLCIGEMREELNFFENKVTALNSSIDTAVEDYKVANGKFFGKAKAVQEATEVLCSTVINYVINDREIYRRNGAISFYVWLLSDLNAKKRKMQNIETTIRDACAIIRNKISKISSELNNPRGLFEVDLTQPYIQRVVVKQEDVNINQFVKSLSEGEMVYDFDNCTVERVAELIYKFSDRSTLDDSLGSLTVESALLELPIEEARSILKKAIDLSSPMCAIDYRGYLNNPLNNYYYIGVEEQSTTRLKGEIINLDELIPGGEIHATHYASIGAKDRIVIYHQYGVFPAYSIAGYASYRQAHDNYMQRSTAYSCFLDEDVRMSMKRDNFSVEPQQASDGSLELWVKGLIFGLITRDEKGCYFYKDESNADMALWGYKTSLNSTYRDEAFKKFKMNYSNLQDQYERYVANRAKSEGQDAIDRILSDAREHYLEKYSLNDLSLESLGNSLYRGIREQLTSELNYVKDNL